MKSSKDNQWISEENKDMLLSATTVLGDREEQQDCFGYEISDNKAFVVLCDGMGGYSGGKIASNSAVELYLEEYKLQKDNISEIDFLTHTTEKANLKILELKNEVGKKLNGGTTVVSIIISKGKLYWASSGDSRVYLFRNGEIAQLTTDHNYRTVLKEKLNMGLIDRETFDREGDRGEALISFLGIGRECLIDYNSEGLALLPGDRIILMSDGLYKLVADEDIARVLENFSSNEDALNVFESKARKVATNAKIQRDNMTVALIKIR